MSIPNDFNPIEDLKHNPIGWLMMAMGSIVTIAAFMLLWVLLP